jgi:hypothetical protein
LFNPQNIPEESYNHLHFIHEEIDAQRCSVSCQHDKLLTEFVMEPEFGPMMFNSLNAGL